MLDNKYQSWGNCTVCWLIAENTEVQGKNIGSNISYPIQNYTKLPIVPIKLR